MADTKVSALTADASPTSDDLIYTVNSPGGTPASRKVTLANVMALVLATPTITGHPTVEGITSTGATGTGKFVFDGTPTISTPTISGHPTVEGVTSTGATGTGKFVFDGTPTIATPVISTPTINSIARTDGAAVEVGFRGVPVNSQSAAYTTVLSDAGKVILHALADTNDRTFTIDSSANVAYPAGTVLTFVNQVNTVTIAITTDTMKLAGAGTTGSRTLAANGIATAVKLNTGTPVWLISGTGLT
jgi:hypothetical protein